MSAGRTRRSACCADRAVQTVTMGILRLSPDARVASYLSRTLATGSVLHVYVHKKPEEVVVTRHIVSKAMNKF